MPRYWIPYQEVKNMPAWGGIGFKDITSPTNKRTMIGACVPMSGYTNHFVIMASESTQINQVCLLANMNSFIYDYCTRQKIGGVTLNFFIVEQIPTLSPDIYSKPCPWDANTTLESWIAERVLKLTCTSEDMLPLAKACNFTDGSFKSEYGGQLNKWDDQERAELMAELDGIHEEESLFHEHCSMAQRIMEKYSEMS